MYYIGIDLGGTNIASGIVDENKNIIATANIKTRAPRPDIEIVDDIINSARLALKNAQMYTSDILSVGIGAPGSVNPYTGVIATSNNLGFTNLPLKKMVEKNLKLPVFVENDANAAAYGEFLAGAGRETKDFVAITLGTGVGGGVIVNGKIMSGHNYAGAELGHVSIIKDGNQCTCGRKGCWEVYASATALISQTKEAMLKNKDSILWSLVNGNINEVNGRTAFDGMRKDDNTAKQVVSEYIEYVACGVTNVINIFQPEVLCIGGGISKEGDTLVLPIIDYVNKNQYARNNSIKTKIKIAERGNQAGIIGAAFLEKLYK